MSQMAWDIEQIVQEVLAALGASTPEGASASAQGAPGSPSVPEQAGSQETKCPTSQSGPNPPSGDNMLQTAGEDGQVWVASRLVTMAELRAHGVPENLAGLRRVLVRPDALVTPQVRDELQRQNIPLVRVPGLLEQSSDGLAKTSDAHSSGVRLVSLVPSAQNQAGGWGLVLLVHGKAYETAGLVRTLSNEGVPVEVHGTECILAAADQLAEGVRSGRCLGVLLTQYPSIGVCAANRHAGVRAVWGIESSQAAVAVASLGANVLVIAPREVSSYQLQKMIREFYGGGVRPCPEPLRSRLG